MEEVRCDTFLSSLPCSALLASLLSSVYLYGVHSLTTEDDAAERWACCEGVSV